MRRFGVAAGFVLVLAGLFWAGRESSHGLGAFTEHWWCAAPLAAMAVGVAGLVVLRRLSPGR